MKILELVQGTDSWLEARLNHLCASEAPAMMDESKFMSRNQLLDLKKGWQSNPNSSFKEALFEKGHQSEENARSILEFEECDDFPPVVGMVSYSTLEGLLASFDGLCGDEGSYIPWEHKEWNETLAENVRNSVLEPHYYWQLEHQMLVANCKEIMFTCSDGTEKNRVSMMYISDPKNRKALVAGWKQFLIDLDQHLLEAKKEMVRTKKEPAFPLITFDVSGTQITSNIASCLEIITQKAEIEISRELESDQDFANKDKFNKATKEARDKLKSMVEDVQGRFVSYSEFAGVAAEIDKVLQKMQSGGEKQVKLAKDAKKKAIKDGGILAVNEHIQSINNAIHPMQITYLMNCTVDFASSMKNKRTIESLVNAVDSVVAEFKIAADEMKNKVVANLLTLREMASDHEFLFMDSGELVKKDNEDLIAVIKNRITDHEQAEAERKRLEKEKIEREAKEKAEREAQAKLDEDREKIRKEEQAKAQAEQKIKSDKEAEERAEADRIAGLAQQEEHRIAKDKRDQRQEDIVDGKFNETFNPLVCDGNHGGPKCGDPECWNDDKPNQSSMAESMAKGAPTLANFDMASGTVTATLNEEDELTKVKNLLKQVMGNYQVAASIAENEGYETNYDQDKILVDFLLND